MFTVIVQTSNDGGKTWSDEYQYDRASEDLCTDIQCSWIDDEIAHGADLRVIDRYWSDESGTRQTTACSGEDPYYQVRVCHWPNA